MPRLINKGTGALLGTVSAADVQVLVDQLEEEGMTDVDYFVDLDTVEILEDGGASAEMLQLLRTAIGSTEGVEIRWEK